LLYRLYASTPPLHSYSFFSDTPPTELYTLSLHDALPIYFLNAGQGANARRDGYSVLSFPGNLGNTPVEMMETLAPIRVLQRSIRDRKSTRLNSSHVKISYAVFCLKKKTNTTPQHDITSSI